MDGAVESPEAVAHAYLERVRGLLAPVAAAAAGVEAARQLTPEIAELLRAAGMFAATAPRAWGGLELDPVTQIEALEMLATADASIAWCAMIGCDTGYIGAFLEETAAKSLLSDITRASVFVANPTGTATPTEGGYTVSGRWTFASGSTHAAVFALGCLVPGPNGPRMANETAPEIRMAVMRADQARVIDTWTTTGARGSGSHDVAADEVFVPECNTFALFPAAMTRPEPLYRYPLLFSMKLGAVALGCARGAIDEVVALSASKGSFGTRSKIREQEWLHEAIARAEMTLAQARAAYYEATRTAWGEMQAGGHPSPRSCALLNLAQVGAIERSTEVVDAMYRAGGSASIYAGRTSLDRRLRDMHTMAQHTVVSHRSIVESGRVLLGM